MTNLKYMRKLCHFVHNYPSYPHKIKYFVNDIELKAPHAYCKYSMCHLKITLKFELAIHIKDNN